MLRLAKPVKVDGILVPGKAEGKTWVPDLIAA